MAFLARSCLNVTLNLDGSHDEVGNSMAGMEALQVITLYQPPTKKFESFSNDMKRQINESTNGTITNQKFVNPYVTEYYNAVRLVINGVTE